MASSEARSIVPVLEPGVLEHVPRKPCSLVRLLTAKEGLGLYSARFDVKLPENMIARR